MAHPTEALNNRKYQMFRVRARAASIAEVHVQRLEKRDHVTLKYNARDKKKGVINGEWTVSRQDRTPEDVDAKIGEFLDMLAKEFRVQRHDVPAAAVGDGADEKPAAKAEPKKAAATKDADGAKKDAGARKKPAAKKAAAKSKAKAKAKGAK